MRASPAALALGVAALLARNHMDSKGGIAAACGLTLYNALAGVLLVWVAASGNLGGAALWRGGVYHALMGLLLVYALVSRR